MNDLFVSQTTESVQNVTGEELFPNRFYVNSEVLCRVNEDILEYYAPGEVDYETFRDIVRDGFNVFKASDVVSDKVDGVWRFFNACTKTEIKSMNAFTTESLITQEGVGLVQPDNLAKLNDPYHDADFSLYVGSLFNMLFAIALLSMICVVYTEVWSACFGVESSYASRRSTKSDSGSKKEVALRKTSKTAHQV